MNSPPTPGSLPLLRILVVGALVPTVFALVDHMLLQRTVMSGSNVFAFELMVAFTFQVGLLGVLCGRFVEPDWLRWVIFGWGLALMDLNVMWLTITWQMDLLRTSLFAAQFGLLTAWAILGDTHWMIRLPLSILLAVQLCMPFVGQQAHYYDAPLVFLAQTSALGLICGALRSKGYRLSSLGNFQSPLAEGDTLRGLSIVQFGVRDLLAWTTSLAIVLAVAQSAGPHWSTLMAGAVAAIVLVVALWAAVGEGPAWLRLLLLAVFGLAGGFVYTICHHFNHDYNTQWRDILDRYLYQQRWYTLAWPPLAGALLFAVLLIYRTRNYRLTRIDRTRNTATLENPVLTPELFDLSRTTK